MNKELQTVISFCLEHAENAPSAKRVPLYRGLAKICSDKNLAAKFSTLADDLETADHNCREFRFKFETLTDNGSQP